MQKAVRPLLIIGSAWLLLVCGCAYLSLFRPGIATRWRQEPAPPEALTRLALGQAGEVVASASDGSTYEFRYGNYNSPSAWTEVSQPSGSPAINAMGCTPGDGNRIVWPPPGKATSRVRMNCVYMESGYHLEVALLENGEVWSWENERYAYAELFLMFFLALACVAGAPILLTGVGLWVVQKVKKIPS
jgi:hypothetical protein